MDPSPSTWVNEPLATQSVMCVTLWANDPRWLKYDVTEIWSKWPTESLEDAYDVIEGVPSDNRRLWQSAENSSLTLWPSLLVVEPLGGVVSLFFSNLVEWACAYQPGRPTKSQQISRLPKLSHVCRDVYTSVVMFHHNCIHYLLFFFSFFFFKWASTVIMFAFPTSVALFLTFITTASSINRLSKADQSGTVIDLRIKTTTFWLSSFWSRVNAVPKGVWGSWVKICAFIDSYSGFNLLSSSYVPPLVPSCNKNA